MKEYNHTADAMRYAFLSMEMSKKRAEKAKQELYQTLKYGGAFLLGALFASAIWLILNTSL